MAGKVSERVGNLRTGENNFEHNPKQFVPACFSGIL